VSFQLEMGTDAGLGTFSMPPLVSFSIFAIRPVFLVLIFFPVWFPSPRSELPLRRLCRLPRL